MSMDLGRLKYRDKNAMGELLKHHVHRHTDLPVAVGFGIRTAEAVHAITQTADAAVVGSAIVDRIANGLDGNGKPTAGLVDSVLDFVRELAGGLKA